ncbi:hypothetical protein DYI24_02495 [Rhodopseudomonas sp. BR0C11]|uniref:hypothetical protein n=1 Tax=Rhodopseudomonas sp. BR0C11 TaxID=2269370 RepID=UPI0013E0718A|nr:hypothetical protein [Rhodopseudomonas sp. BR0C11]NEV75914.1 hypothetical protein [Rhodopseudomonas sp. BR0C11]
MPGFARQRYSDLSRRTVVTGLGATALASALSTPTPTPALALNYSAAPTLEELFGAECITALREKFRSNDYLLTTISNETALLDANDRFRVSPEFRENFVQFVLYGRPFEQFVDFDDIITSDEGLRHVRAHIEGHVVMVFLMFGRMPGNLEEGVPKLDPWRIRWWHGDDWKSVGWPDPEDGRYWLKSPTLYYFRLAVLGQYLNEC